VTPAEPVAAETASSCHHERSAGWESEGQRRPGKLAVFGSVATLFMHRACGRDRCPQGHDDADLNLPTRALINAIRGAPQT
jgi:hypothetical protein